MGNTQQMLSMVPAMVDMAAPALIRMAHITSMDKQNQTNIRLTEPNMLPSGMQDILATMAQGRNMAQGRSMAQGRRMRGLSSARNHITKVLVVL